MQLHRRFICMLTTPGDARGGTTPPNSRTFLTALPACRPLARYSADQLRPSRLLLRIQTGAGAFSFCTRGRLSLDHATRDAEVMASRPQKRCLNAASQVSGTGFDLPHRQWVDPPQLMLPAQNAVWEMPALCSALSRGIGRTTSAVTVHLPRSQRHTPRASTAHTARNHGRMPRRIEVSRLDSFEAWM